MHLLQIRDHLVRHLDDLGRRDVELHQLMDLNCDMDLMHLHHLVHLLQLDVVQNLDVLDHLHRQDVVHLDVQQNQDVVHLDVVHLDALHPLVVVVGVELRHRLRMDYFLDAVDVEPPSLMRMDYFLDEVQQVHPVSIDLVLVELQALVLQEHLELQHVPLLLMQLLPVLLHVMPSTLRDQHRVLRRVLLQVLRLVQR